MGDVKEFTIIALDTDRRRISLSLKSDAGQRLAGASTGSTSASGERKTVVTGGKKVVVIKKGGANTAHDGKRDFNRDRPRSNDRPRRDYGSDDGMTYNAFAAAFAKMKK